MAIDKNDYLDGNGNYDLKKELVDELIDAVNPIADYVVDSGSSGDAEYIKYNSGRITIRNKGIANSSILILDIPYTIISTASGKPRYSFATVATYMGSKSIWVKSCYVENQSGVQKIVIELSGTGIENIPVTYEINAWWK